MSGRPSENRRYVPPRKLADITCIQCGIQFRPINHRIRYCSRSCHMRARALPLEQRFWPKVKRRGPDECWEWTAKLSSTGYGRFRTGGLGSPEIAAHRMSWILTNGDIPSGLFACHHCDNPKCVNPKHLFIGTQAENVHDMWAKGRGRPPPKKTKCKRGHEFTPDNTYVLKGGGRRCRECLLRAHRAAYHNRRAI